MKAAGKHWLLLRLTALPLIVLLFYFITQTQHLAAANRLEFINWAKQPLNASALGVFIICAYYHGSLGVHEIIEDYAPSAALKAFNKIFFLGLEIVSLYAVLAIYLGKF